MWFRTKNSWVTLIRLAPQGVNGPNVGFSRAVWNAWTNASRVLLVVATNRNQLVGIHYL